MKNIASTIAVVITAFSFNASAEDLSIKGYAPGQPLSACPENSVSTPGKPLLMCSLGATTYAGAEAKDISLVIYNNEIIGVMVALRERGPHANSGVLAAMKEKFGNPTESKPHVNEYRWRQGSVILSFDGYRGTVLLADIEKNRKAVESGAKANKGDL